MGKTLYSLMLNENVVREIDILAHKSGTSRSNLVNQILAEYVNYTTPERRISDVFNAIEQLMMPSSEIIPFFAPNSQSMSLKSSLEYKYRPTVKYEVELYGGTTNSIGRLSVIFRTQSQSLIRDMTDFFRLWKQIEDAHLPKASGRKAEYELYDGKFVRSISLPERDCTAEELAKAISSYIELFDKQMKYYLCGRADAGSIEIAYYNYLMNTAILI